jgi:hypothetical protein
MGGREPLHHFRVGGPYRTSQSSLLVYSLIELVGEPLDWEEAWATRGGRRVSSLGRPAFRFLRRFLS